MNESALVRRKLATINRQALKVETARGALQHTCKHLTLTMKYEGSTGNYDRSDDCYWIAWSCQDCQKRWTTDQGIEHTRLYPHAVKVR